jgi:hypothetical protein
MLTSSATYEVFYDEQIAAVIMNWNGYATSEQFKEGTELMLNTLIQNNAHKVLADIKDMAIIGMEDQRWLDTQFLPRATQFGFKALAIVRPKNYFNNVAVETISYKVDKEKLAINFFDNIEAARQWLSEAE